MPVPSETFPEYIPAHFYDLINPLETGQIELRGAGGVMRIQGGICYYSQI